MSEMQKVYQFRILSLHQLEKVYEIAKNLKKKKKPTKPHNLSKPIQEEIENL